MDPQTPLQPQSPISAEPRPAPGVEVTSLRPEVAPVPMAPEAAPAPGAPPAAAAIPTAMAAPMTIPAVVPVQPAPLAAPPLPQMTVGPATADDVDVIEKEWVDKAQEVVRATSQDPHAEEEAVEDLQIDYLKKRYGKEIKKPGLDK